MSTMLISLGLQSFKPPTQKQIAHKEKLRKANDKKSDEALTKLRKVLKHYVMSTRDISFFLRIERASAAKYLAKQRELGNVEEVGETIHAGDHSKQLLWRLK